MSNQQMQVPDWGFLRLHQVLQIVPVSRSTFLAGIKEGRYPRPIKLSSRVSAWSVKEIRELAESLKVDAIQER